MTNAAAGHVLTTGVEVLWVARFDYVAGRPLRLHTHPYWQIIVVHSGAGTFLLDGESVPLAPGQTWLLRPDQPHGLHPAGAVRTLDIKFTADPAWHTALASLPALTVAAPAEVPERIERVRGLARTGAAYARTGCAVHLQVALVALLQHHAGAPAPREAAAERLPRNPLCADVLAYLHAHYAEPITGAMLAEALGYSYRHISQQCVAALGVTPLHYLQHYRIRRAQDLMRWSDYPTKEIAARVGFATVHHFTRVFTHLVGMPPARWRAVEADAVGQGFVLQPGFENVLFV